MTGRRITAALVLLALAACTEPDMSPLPMPAATGKPEKIYGDDGYFYLISYQSLQQARGKVYLRVTRASAPELTYSDGVTGKRIAEAYCAQYRRGLNPVAYGAFSAPASWIYEGGCT